MGIILITGGSGSGKSAFAEETVRAIAQKESRPLFYLATMRVYGREEEEKVARHRRMRAGKGFRTIEQPRDILRAASHADTENACALLECVSNLAANEMFAETEIRPEEEVVRKIADQIGKLSRHFSVLTVVTNNIFEDGAGYDAATLAYIRALGKINRILAGQAEEVWEVVSGIPVCIKEKDA